MNTDLAECHTCDWIAVGTSAIDAAFRHSRTTGHPGTIHTPV